MKRFYFLPIIFTILWISPSLAQDLTYQHTITVEQMTFQWSLEPELIHIKLAAKTTGWVGVGFNPSQAMKDADFVIGYVKNGQANVKEQIGSGLNSHMEKVKSGGKDNVTNISGKEENGMTEITFTLPLKSGDKFNTMIDPNGETTVLLAYGAGMKSFLIKHQYRTALKVNLSTGSYQAIKK